jgi:hypothetical protein
MADKVGSRNPARSRYWHCWHCRRCSRCRRLFAPPLVLQIWAFTDLSPIISFALRLAGSCTGFGGWRGSGRGQIGEMRLDSATTRDSGYL